METRDADRNADKMFAAMFEALGRAVEWRSGYRFEARAPEEGGGGVGHVWLPIGPDGARRVEPAALLAEIEAAPAGAKLVLAPTRANLPLEFQSEARARGAATRAYAEIVDDVYRGRGGDGTTQIIVERDAALTKDREALQDQRRAAGARLLGPELLDEAREGRAVSAARLNPALSSRVRQPYGAPRPTSAAGAGFQGGDLLADLARHLTRAPGGAKSEVIFVVGHAGVGKSQLFEALYAYMLERFLTRKRAYALARRPVAATPEHILNAASYASDALFDAVTETPELAVGSVGLLDWRLKHGCLTLMFDGLDEFFASQDDFFEELQRRYFNPGDQAQIVIFLRDSLLATSPAVKALRTKLESERAVDFGVYELTLWRDDDALLRDFLWRRLEGRAPPSSEAPSEAVSTAMALLQSAPELREVATLPFFLEALVTYLQARPKGAAERLDLFAALDHLIESVVEREWGKLNQRAGDAAEGAFATGADRLARLQWRLFGWAKSSTFGRAFETAFGGMSLDDETLRGLEDFAAGAARVEGREALLRLVEELAHMTRRGGSGALDPGALAKIYRRDRAADLSREARARGERILRQFALFGAEGEAAVSFTHEILADYLAARHAAREIGATPGRAAALVGRAPPDDTGVFERYLRATFAEDARVLEALAPAFGAQTRAAAS